MAFAEREWFASSLGGKEQLLEECPADLRGWEWRYLKRVQYKNVLQLDHESGVLSLAFSPAGPYVASGSQDGVIKVWDTHTGQLLRLFQVPAGKPMAFSLAFSPDGERLAVAYDRRIRIWDVW